MHLEIRRARPGEADTLSGIALRAKAHWGYPAEWLERWRDELTFTPGYLAAHEAFVAVHEGTPAAVCVLHLRGANASLEHLWVDPARHGRGVGRALLTHALLAAAGAGARIVRVVSDPFAEGFYTRYGARRVGEVAAPMPGAPERTLPALEFDLPEP